MCLGHKHGTSCMKVVRTHRHVASWENYQLCTKCSKDNATQKYRDKQNILVSQ